MKDKTLVILAAGMGSRFGGLKQIEPVGPNGEIIADYSVYDALRAGFTKVVFVIREENLDYFKTHITAKYAHKIEVEFAIQSLKKIPSDVTLPKTREKMLGTGHALLCAKDKINGPFVMINADDFYGRSAYMLATKFFEEETDDYTYLSVDYPFYLAKSENGKVNRGVVSSQAGFITKIEESSIETVENRVIATSFATQKETEISPDQPVSLNFFCFKPTIFNFLEKDFDEFIHGPMTDKNELFITDTIKKYIETKDIRFKESISDSAWLGVTYKEDLVKLKESIKSLIANQEYKENLWEEK